MLSTAEASSLSTHGYCLADGVLDGEPLARARAAFDAVLPVLSKPGQARQERVLASHELVALIEHPRILGRMTALFGRQTQLLDIALLRQDAGSTAHDRHWHRDHAFPGDHLLSVNCILYLDDMDAERGPTHVLPGSHRGTAQPPAELIHQPLPGEVAVTARAGDCTLINSAIWHSGSRNRSTGPRRAVYLYFGWWWMKRWKPEVLPASALIGASPARLRLLGVLGGDDDLGGMAPGTPWAW